MTPTEAPKQHTSTLYASDTAPPLPKVPSRTWKINKERYALCFKFFQKLSKEDINGNRYVQGGQAADFLIKSGLQKPVIARILELSDMDKDCKLDRDEWVVAHHLTICISKEDMPCPSKLQDYLIPKGKRNCIK